MTLADPQSSISNFAKAKLIGSLCDGYRLVLICNQLLEQGIQPSVDDFQINIEDEVLTVKAVFLESPMQPNSSWSSITLMMSQLLPKSIEIGVFYRPIKSAMRSVVDKKPLADFDFVTQVTEVSLEGGTPVLPEIVDSSINQGIANRTDQSVVNDDAIEATQSVVNMNSEIEVNTEGHLLNEVLVPAPSCQVQALVKRVVNRCIQIVFDQELDIAKQPVATLFRAEQDDKWLTIAVVYLTKTTLDDWPELWLLVEEDLGASKPVQVSYKSSADGLRIINGTMVESFHSSLLQIQASITKIVGNSIQIAFDRELDIQQQPKLKDIEVFQDGRQLPLISAYLTKSSIDNWPELWVNVSGTPEPLAPLQVRFNASGNRLLTIDGHVLLSFDIKAIVAEQNFQPFASQLEPPHDVQGIAAKPIQPAIDIPALLSKFSQNAQIDNPSGGEIRGPEANVNTHRKEQTCPEDVPSLVSRESSFSEVNRLLRANDVVITKAGETLGESEWGNIVDGFDEPMGREQWDTQEQSWQAETASHASFHVASKVREDNLYVSSDEQLSRFDHSAGHTFEIDDQYIDDMFGAIALDGPQVEIDPAAPVAKDSEAAVIGTSAQMPVAEITLPGDVITVDALLDRSQMAEDFPPRILAKLDVGDVPVFGKPVFGKTDDGADKTNSDKSKDVVATNALDALEDRYADSEIVIPDTTPYTAPDLSPEERQVEKAQTLDVTKHHAPQITIDVVPELSREVVPTLTELLIEEVSADLPVTSLAEQMQPIGTQQIQSSAKYGGLKGVLLMFVVGAVSAVGTYYYVQGKVGTGSESIPIESIPIESIAAKSSIIKPATENQSDHALAQEKSAADLMEQLQVAKGRAVNDLRQLKESRLSDEAQSQKQIVRGLGKEEGQAVALMVDAAAPVLPDTKLTTVGALQSAVSVADVTPDAVSSFNDTAVVENVSDGRIAVGELQNCSVNYQSGNRYNGECLNGAKHGQGVFYWQSGDHYEGGWLSDVRHGDGIMISAGGVRTTGQWLNGQLTGSATIEWPSGTRYIGDIKSGVSHGSGTIFYANGDSYKGEFQRGMKNGYGVLLMSRGAKYEGFYSNNKKQGQGTYWSEKGYRYEGAFRDGYFTQDGTCIEEDGNRYKGPCK